MKLMNFFMQTLGTEPNLSASYRPVFSSLHFNLKRKNIWNSVEVHAIYALIYLLCTNKDGIILFRQYLSCQDQQVFEPYFIAQYLLVPVNTIVKSSLLPWMMKAYLKHKELKFRARNIKAEVFLKYTVLTDLMSIVQKYGRKANYLFEADERLATIMKGHYGPKAKATKNQVTCALDSFLTIFLITLPEKFKQWYDFHNFGNQQGYKKTTHMDLSETPTFPIFKNDSEYTRLSPCPSSRKYVYLPESWDLHECFDYFFFQIDRWTTPSIEGELIGMDSDNSNEEVEVEVDPFPSSDEEQEGEVGNTKVDCEMGQVAGVLVNKFADSTIIKQPYEDENSVITERQAVTMKRSTTHEQSDQQDSTAKKKRRTRDAEQHISVADASQLIFDLAPALADCTKFIEELLGLVKSNQNAQFKIQEF